MGDARGGSGKAARRRWARALLGLAALVLVYAAASVAFRLWPFSVAAKVLGADAMIGNYEWFYDQKAQIDATRSKWKVAKEAGMEEAPGILMVLEGMIAEYNARSSMMTRALWKAADLPYRIESEAAK